MDILLPLKSKKSKINNGYGFVTFKDPECAKTVIFNNKRHILRAKWIDVKIANPRNSTSPNAKAFQERDLEAEEAKDFFTLHPMDRLASQEKRGNDESLSSSTKKHLGPRGIKGRVLNSSQEYPSRPNAAVFGGNNPKSMEFIGQDFSSHNAGPKS